jgi:chromosome segregation ATPase
VNEANKERDEIKSKLDEVEVEKTKVSENLQQSSSEAQREKEELKEKVKSLEQEKTSILDKFQDMDSNKSAEIAELKISLDSLQKDLQELRENSAKLSEEKVVLEKQYQEMILKKNEVENTYQQSLVTVQHLQSESEMLQKVCSRYDNHLQKSYHFSKFRTSGYRRKRTIGRREASAIK